MSTTPEPSQNPPQGGYPPPPPPGGTGGSHAGPPPGGTGGSHVGPPPGGTGGSHAGPPPGGYPPADRAAGYPPGHGAGYSAPPSPYPANAPGGYPPPGYGQGAPLSPSDQRLWAVLSHLGNLLVWIIAPLVLWLVFRGRGAFLEDHAKESVNFQITAGLAAVALTVLTVVTFGIGGLLFVPLGIAWLVLMIVAAVKASQGEPYRYPLTYRFIR